MALQALPLTMLHLSSACLPARSSINRALIAFCSKPSLVVYNSCSQFCFPIWLSSIRLKITFLNTYFIIFVSVCVNVGRGSTHAEAKQGHWISWSWTCRWLIATGYRGWELLLDFLEEEQVVSTAEASLQTPELVFHGAMNDRLVLDMCPFSFTGRA